VGELLAAVDAGEISGKQAKEVFSLIEGSDRSPKAVIEERGMRVVSDSSALTGVVEAVIAKFPDQVASIRAGKKSVTGFLVGQIMKETKGSANPKLVNELLEKLIGGAS
jgi:aspartyl-tRNA(Asn)/glutamyl-tRNA(Gln) amidotransferase subunit B